MVENKGDELGVVHMCILHDTCVTHHLKKDFCPHGNAITQLQTNKQPTSYVRDRIPNIREEAVSICDDLLITETSVSSVSRHQEQGTVGHK